MTSKLTQFWTAAVRTRKYTSALQPCYMRGDAFLIYIKLAICRFRHNSEPFSKFAFLSDKYKEFDMSDFDITNVRDYAMYMALASKQQVETQV